MANMWFSKVQLYRSSLGEWGVTVGYEKMRILPQDKQDDLERLLITCTEPDGVSYKTNGDTDYEQGS